MTASAVSLFESIETSLVATENGITPSMRRAAMLEHPTLAVAAMQKGRIRETNAPWKALFTLPPVSVESHVATLFPNVTSADRFERALQSELATTQAGCLIARSEHLLMRRDGGAFLAEIVIWLFSAEDVDRPLGGDAIWQVRDITVERTLRRELRDLEEYHRELSRHRWDMTFVIDRKGRISYASSSIEGALGYRVHGMLGEPFAALLDPAHVADAERWLRVASQSQADDDEIPSGDGFPLQVLHSDGSVRVLACRTRDCFAIPRIAGMVIHARDVTVGAVARNEAPRADVAGASLRTALIEIARSPSEGGSDRVTSLLASIGEPIAAAAVTFWQAAQTEGPPKWIFRATHRASAEDAVPPLLSGLGASDVDVLLVLDDLEDAPVGDPDAKAVLQATQIGALVEVPVVDDAQTVGWLAVAAAEPRRWSDAEVDFLVGGALLVALALREQPSYEEPSAVRATDKLTGLPDRVAAERHLADRIADAGRASPLVALVVDLDRLQDVNHDLGLSAGDVAIGRTAKTLKEIAGAEGFVARIGDDEFLLVVEGFDARQTDTLAQTILDRVGDAAGGDHVSVEASIGVARFVDDGTDAATLLLQADLAMREAKARGGRQVCIFNPRLAAGLRAQKDLDGEIEGALARNEFTIFYQPQIGFASGEVVGLEALLRWEHPTRGLLLPDAFIGAAFKGGLIDALTKSVLTQVCEQLAAWRRVGKLPELPVAVNVSGRQFNDRRLPALVASALLKSGLPARLLVLEITEESLIGDAAGIERVVKELSRLGVRISISDFNVGYASFKYLRQLSVSQIKLASGFIKGLPQDAESVIFVAAFVDLARRLKYQVVAEGVETRQQFEHLREIGCGVGQGFYLGAPLSAAEIDSFVASNQKSPVH
jgi:diguanylate cyclase (GGDEF)-like protein/PAS domain S-box-containing protein